MDLRKDGAELHLQARNNDKLAHAIADRALLQIQIVHWKVVESLVDTRCTFLEHLHLLIAQRHIVEHHKEMELITSA